MNLLAVDFGSLFAVAFLLISFIGWIMNLINAQNPPPQPNRPQRKPQPRDRKVQSEIEDFLQQAMGRRGPQQKKSESDGIEILEPQESRRRSPPREAAGSPKAAPVARTRQESSKPSPHARSGEESQPFPNLGSTDFGSSLRTHLEQHMGSRVAQRVEQDLPHLINQSIATHLGESRADDDDTRRDVTPVVGSRDSAALLAELRRPAGMRKAIVLQELLSKPLAMRKG